MSTPNSTPVNLCGEVMSISQSWLGQTTADPDLVFFVCTMPDGHDPPCVADGVTDNGIRYRMEWREQ